MFFASIGTNFSTYDVENTYLTFRHTITMLKRLFDTVFFVYGEKKKAVSKFKMTTIMTLF
jgi:hypothetical protein